MWREEPHRQRQGPHEQTPERGMPVQVTRLEADVRVSTQLHRKRTVEKICVYCTGMLRANTHTHTHIYIYMEAEICR